MGITLVQQNNVCPCNFNSPLSFLSVPVASSMASKTFALAFWCSVSHYMLLCGVRSGFTSSCCPSRLEFWLSVWNLCQISSRLSQMDHLTESSPIGSENKVSEVKMLRGFVDSCLLNTSRQFSCLKRGCPSSTDQVTSLIFVSQVVAAFQDFGELSASQSAQWLALATFNRQSSTFQIRPRAPPGTSTR